MDALKTALKLAQYQQIIRYIFIINKFSKDLPVSLSVQCLIYKQETNILATRHSELQEKRQRGNDNRGPSSLSDILEIRMTVSIATTVMVR